MKQLVSQDFHQLVNQVQIAHRLVVGFYQRLLPTIKGMADELDLSFWGWDPSVTNRPCRSSKQPAEHWAWDMVPLLDSNHYYWRTTGKTARVGDVCLSFWVHIDSSFGREDWTKFGLTEKQEPDATQMPIGQALVYLYVFRCVQDSDQSFEALYESASDVDESEPKAGKWQRLAPENNLVGMYLKVPLVDFISDHASLTERLRTYLEGPFDEADFALPTP